MGKRDRGRENVSKVKEEWSEIWVKVQHREERNGKG
jgi:hypothetical protein